MATSIGNLFGVIPNGNALSRATPQGDSQSNWLLQRCNPSRFPMELAAPTPLAKRTPIVELAPPAPHGIGPSKPTPQRDPQ